MSIATNNDSLPRDKGHKNKADDDKADSMTCLKVLEISDIDHHENRTLEEVDPHGCLVTSTLIPSRKFAEILNLTFSNRQKGFSRHRLIVVSRKAAVRYPLLGKRRRGSTSRCPSSSYRLTFLHGSAGAENPVPPLSVALCMRQVRFACRVSPSLCLVSCITPCMCMQKTKLQEIRGPNSSHASLLFLEFPFVLFFRHTSKYQNKKESAPAGR